MRIIRQDPKWLIEKNDKEKIEVDYEQLEALNFMTGVELQEYERGMKGVKWPL